MRDKIVELIDKLETNLEQVECDDYGDPIYKWHLECWLGTDFVWEDWFIDKPDEVKIYNTLLESAKDGSLGDILKCYIAEEESYNKMLNERRA